ncbi:MAG: hypothetical protein ACP5VP_09965 [Candidatus Limnocylindrales bacterium]
MSSRHQQNRRRAYGRRQHEVRERQERLESALREEVACSPLRTLEPSGDRLARMAFGRTPMGWAEGAA